YRRLLCLRPSGTSSNVARTDPILVRSRRLAAQRLGGGCRVVNPAPRAGSDAFVQLVARRSRDRCPADRIAAAAVGFRHRERRHTGWRQSHHCLPGCRPCCAAAVIAGASAILVGTRRLPAEGLARGRTVVHSLPRTAVLTLLQLVAGGGGNRRPACR